MDWYNVWQENNYFTIEKNILKKKQTVFTNFIKVNQNGFLNADFRSYLYADTLARYYRFKGYNVASTIGFDSLAYSSFLENTNKDMTIPFKEELEKLNVGYPKNKLIDNNDKTVVNLIQQIFLSLYNKDIIKYKDMDVYKEKEKIYDPIEINGNRQLTKEKAFVLDYSKYLNRITNHLVNLSIEDEYKEYLFTKLGAYDTLVINLETKNKKNIELYLQEPEELGALEAIIINPNHLDILEYIAPNEIFAVENFLIHQNKTYLYTGNYVINPLTGLEVPIFISFKHNEAYKFVFSTKDEEIISDLGLTFINIYKDNCLINSDFLNGLTKEAAREKIVEVFSEEMIAEKVKTYHKTEILISSLDKYGALFPLALENNKLITLENFLPIILNKSGIIEMGNKDKLPNVKFLDFTINSLFLKGIEPILTILYDKFNDTDLINNKTTIKDLANWLNNINVIVNKNNLIANILMPLIILSIIEEEENVVLLKNYEITLVDNTYDSYGSEIKRKNNNCIKVNDLIASYGADAIRLYVLSTNMKDKLYFDSNKIFIFKQFLNKVKMIFKRGCLVSNYDLDFPLYQLKNKLYDALAELNFAKYINELRDFVNKYLGKNNFTKKQGLEFLTILSLVSPETAEEINANELHYKQLIIDSTWPL